MTDASLPTNRFSEGTFDVGRVVTRTVSVLSRNLLPFSLVTAVASLPNVLISSATTGLAPTTTGNIANLDPVTIGVGAVVAGLLMAALGALSQAVVLYGAFEDMRGRRVDLMESMRIGLRRFFPVVGVALLVTFLGALGFLLLIVPGLIWFMMWFVAMPVCVVEGLGPWRSMKRSAALTKGNRWKIFGLWFVVALIGGIMGGLLTGALAGLSRVVGGPVLALILRLAWSAIVGAFGAILAVVVYHDLRVAKEGVDTDQIAAVFD
jgi:hypothetical protein